LGFTGRLALEKGLALEKEKVILTRVKDLIPGQSGLCYTALNALSIVMGISV